MILSHEVSLQNNQSRKIQSVAQDTVMSFLCGLISWHKKILGPTKLLREVDFSFVVWRAIGFILQERLPSIVVEKFMSWTKFLSITKT